MKQWTGKLERIDIGTGAWVLETPAGERMALYGPVPEHLNGEKVVVDGEVLDGMGIAMVGREAVQVASVRLA